MVWVHKSMSGRTLSPTIELLHQCFCDGFPRLWNWLENLFLRGQLHSLPNSRNWCRGPGDGESQQRWAAPSVEAQCSCAVASRILQWLHHIASLAPTFSCSVAVKILPENCSCMVLCAPFTAMQLCYAVISKTDSSCKMLQIAIVQVQIHDGPPSDAEDPWGRIETVCRNCMKLHAILIKSGTIST